MPVMAILAPALHVRALNWFTAPVFSARTRWSARQRQRHPIRQIPNGGVYAPRHPVAHKDPHFAYVVTAFVPGGKGRPVLSVRPLTDYVGHPGAR